MRATSPRRAASTRSAALRYAPGSASGSIRRRVREVMRSAPPASQGRREEVPDAGRAGPSPEHVQIIPVSLYSIAEGGVQGVAIGDNVYGSGGATGKLPGSVHSYATIDGLIE
jgi:hypothetical protein